MRIAQTDKQPKTVAEAMKACGVLAETEDQRKQILGQLGRYLKEHASIVIGRGDSEIHMSGFVGGLGALSAKDKVDFFAGKIPGGSEAELFWLSQAFSGGLWGEVVDEASKNLQKELEDRAMELLSLFRKRETNESGAGSCFSVLINYVDEESEQAREAFSDLLTKLDIENRAWFFPVVPRRLIQEKVLDVVRQDFFSSEMSTQSRDQLVGGLDDSNNFGQAIETKPDFGLQIIEELLINQLTDSSPLEFKSFATMMVVDNERESTYSPFGGSASDKGVPVSGSDVVARRLLDTLGVRILIEHAEKSDAPLAARAAKIVKRIRSLDGYKKAKQREQFAALKIEEDLQAIEAFAKGDGHDTGAGGGNKFSSFVRSKFEQRQSSGGGGLGGGGFGRGGFGQGGVF